MFDNLDNIKWESFGTHIAMCVDSKDIPRYIRQLFDDDFKQRIWALECLFGEGQHTGIHDTATPYIIPFALEVLANDVFRNKDYLIDYLHFVASYVLSASTVRQMRLGLQVYDELVKGFDLYIELLSHPSPQVRICSCKLLRYMQDHSTEVLDAFRQRFEVEKDEDVRSAILENMARLLRECRLLYNPEIKIYHEFITTLVSLDFPFSDRLAASQAIVTLDFRISSETSTIVANTLYEAMKSAAKDYEKTRIAIYLSYVDSQELLRLLKQELVPMDAHLLVRAILCSYYIGLFDEARQQHWDYRTDYNAEGMSYWVDQYNINYMQATRRVEILPAILACDPYWEISTNLLSLFYHLPDERDALRQYIETAE